MLDAIVIGVGGVGSAALWQLAARGQKVLGLDRFPPGHDRGSSHGETRIIRKAYFEHADYVPLLERTYALWAEIEALARRQLFHRVGLLEVGPADGSVVPGVLKAAREHRLQVEALDERELPRRFPAMRFPEHAVGVFEPDAGYLLVEDCVRAQANAAAALGAQLQIGEAVQAWRAMDDGVEVVTDRATYRAARLVITAGAWAGELLSGDGLPARPFTATGRAAHGKETGWKPIPQDSLSLRVLRKHVYWFAAPPHVYDHATADFPTFLFELPHGVFYGFPDRGDGRIKVAEHSGGAEVIDPLIDPRDDDPQMRERVSDFVRRHLPLADADRIVAFSRCFYTMSPDEHFIVDRHPLHPQVVFAAGLSGHGFKFAPVLGEVLADLALEGKTKLPTAFLGLGRFAGKS